MNLFFRLLFTWFVAPFRSKVDLIGPCLTPFRCWPTDLDVLRHMNNGKYFSLMDLARVDLMIRSDALPKIDQAGFYPVVVAETIRFHKSIHPFRPFMIETKILGWDQKAFILEQRFVSKNTIHAEAIVRARFLKKTGGSVDPTEILKLVHYTNPSPELTEWVKEWNLAQSIKN